MFMKTGLKIAVLLFVALATANCSDKNDDGGKKKLETSGWMLTSWNNSTDLAGKVFLQLNADGSFALYQSINTPGFETFTGTYRIADDVLSGEYSDGTAWESSYAVQTHSEEALILKSKTDATVSVYKKGVIPDYVKQANPGDVRSAVAEPFL